MPQLVWAQAFAPDAVGRWTLSPSYQPTPPSGAARTGFGGYIQIAPPPGGRDAGAGFGRFLNPNGIVAQIGDTVLRARDIGQVSGHAADQADPPNHYFAASAARGQHIIGRDRNGDLLPDILTTGAPDARWMPGQWGPHADAGPGSIWKVDGTTGALSLFASLRVGPEGLGALRFDPASEELRVTIAQTGQIARLDLAGRRLDDAPEVPEVAALSIRDALFVPRQGRGRASALAQPGTAQMRCQPLRNPGPNHATARCMATLPAAGKARFWVDRAPMPSFATDPGVQCKLETGELLCEGAGRVTLWYHGDLPFVSCMAAPERQCQTVGAQADLRIITRADWGRGGSCSTTQPCVFTYELRNAGPEAYAGPVTLRTRMRLDREPALGRFSGVSLDGCTPEALDGPGCTFDIALAPGETRWIAVRYEPRAGTTGYLRGCVALYDTGMTPEDDPFGVDWQSSCADIAVIAPVEEAPKADSGALLSVALGACDGACEVTLDLPQARPLALDIRFADPVIPAPLAEGMDCLRGDALGLPCVVTETGPAPSLRIRQSERTEQLCARLGLRPFAVQRAQVVQALLNAQGIDAGPVDGLPGSKTRAAIAELHEALELPKATGIEDAVQALALPIMAEPVCVTIPARPAVPKCLPWERPMAKDCAPSGTICAPGETRTATGACAPRQAACPPWHRQTESGCVPLPPRCDHASTWRQAGCPCKYIGMLRLSPAQCRCPANHTLVPGQGCRQLRAE